MNITSRRLFVCVVLIVMIACQRQETSTTTSTETTDTTAPQRAPTPPPPPANPVTVNVRIVGSSILDTVAADQPLTLLLPKVAGHEPFIYANDAHAPTAGTITPTSQTYDGVIYKIFKINGNDIEFDQPAVETSIKYSMGWGLCPIPNGSDKHSLQWLPSLGMILNGKRGTIDPAYVPDASMKIERGTLLAQIRGPERYAYMINFNPAADTVANAVVKWEQAAAAMVLYTFTVDLPAGTPLSITGTPTGSGVRPVLFSVKPPPGTTTIELTIGSSMPNNVFPKPPPLVPIPDLHFRDYYAALQGAPAGALARPFALRTAYTCRSTPSNPGVDCGPVTP
ncbi:MAG TPA: hypothetical protein VGQ36_07855 [Thermoanaerobaculia bacterium]|jgi:hypothetical protein|nr:hypothetical protein [Thermoanaerobaculia bacterium]